MLNKLRDWLIARTLIDGGKSIEKLDWMTKALEICYKQGVIKGTWISFLNTVDGILDDAKDEVKNARSWK